MLPSVSDWVLGGITAILCVDCTSTPGSKPVEILSRMWWIGYLEQRRPPIWPLVFHVDYSDCIWSAIRSATALGISPTILGTSTDVGPIPLRQEQASFDPPPSEFAPTEDAVAEQATGHAHDEVPEQDISGEPIASPLNGPLGLPHISIPLRRNNLVLGDARSHSPVVTFPTTVRRRFGGEFNCNDGRMLALMRPISRRDPAVLYAHA